MNRELYQHIDDDNDDNDDDRNNGRCDYDAFIIMCMIAMILGKIWEYLQINIL
jgi:hypothetical protein